VHPTEGSIPTSYDIGPAFSVDKVPLWSFNGADEARHYTPPQQIFIPEASPDLVTPQHQPHSFSRSQSLSKLRLKEEELAQMYSFDDDSDPALTPPDHPPISPPETKVNLKIYHPNYPIYLTRPGQNGHVSPSKQQVYDSNPSYPFPQQQTYHHTQFQTSVRFQMICLVLES
jgi:hypothetical protein